MHPEQDISHLLEQYRNVPGGLLPLLHAIQAELGYIPPDTVEAIASAMNLSRAEVHGVISFYHDFRSEPLGRHRVQICRAEACQAMGSRELEAHAMATLGMAFGETSADGAITLEPVYCLGNCACTPSIRVGDRVYARVTPERFDEILEGQGGA